MEVTLAQALAAFVSAGLGAALAVSIGVSHKQLCALISIAAGTLLAAATFHIVPESLELLTPAKAVIALMSGYGFFFLVSRYVSHMCPACAASHFDESHDHGKTKSTFLLLSIALTIHSIMDGMAIALGHELSESTNHSIFFTISIHKLPEGLALCALLLGSGQERMKSFLWTLVFESSTMLGWALGFWGLQGLLDAMWVQLLMVHIAGGFVYLSLHAVINEVRDHSPRFILGFFLIGFLFMALAH